MTHYLQEMLRKIEHRSLWGFKKIIVKDDKRNICMNYYIRPPPLSLPAFTFDIELLNRNSYIYMYTSMHKHLFHNLGRSIVMVQKLVFEYYCIVFILL